ncbi:MAG: hypothetical protein E7047_07100 [Lentisphaerae bacterium]|nr:hypothetical protein [Lentisphaerota bacterium]
MFKNSPLYRSVYAAWELCFDWHLPMAMRPDPDKKSARVEEIVNPLYFMPIFGALAGLLALIAGNILFYLLPQNGASVCFAILLTVLGELRTSGRGLALCVTFFDVLTAQKSFSVARELRSTSLRNSTGLIALLLAIGMLFGKFMALFLVARTTHCGVASAALVAALSVEAVLAAEPSASGVPRFCRRARAEFIVAIGGFLLLFNLIFLALPTLICAGFASVLAIVFMNLFINLTGGIDSDDMTMTGYITEFAVWLLMAIMIA